MRPPPQLILFDIDMTLITSGGLGMDALEWAGKSLFGSEFSKDGIDFSGRLDPLIIADLLAKNGIHPTPEHAQLLADGYANRLETLLLHPGVCTMLPGVPELLEAVHAHDNLAPGILTGNFERTGRLKLSAAGIDSDRFTPRVWGNEGPRDFPAREALVPIAIERFSQHINKQIDPVCVTVIGDTTHDIACAQASGCRSVGVATGRFPPAVLREAGADLVLDTLEDTQGLIEWILSSKDETDRRLHL